MESFRKCMAYIGLHTFGMKLIYPGSCCFMPRILGLKERRSQLLSEYGCESRKIKTKDNNIIDTIFLDHRHQGARGDILVICCEGSASFYEDGCLVRVPIEAGYSMLGWNHPGFGESTGKPTPSQEENAIDAVVKYAIYKLNFKSKYILFYGWSIGSYTASWAAMSYPNCRGLILDGPFDEMTDLAKNAMPQWLHPTVEVAIKNYINLNVAEHVNKYEGPILIIRRTRDEVLCLEEGVLSTNRANNLLLEILRYRFPFIMTIKVTNVLEKFLAETGKDQVRFARKYNLDNFECVLYMQSYIIKHSRSYPMAIGEELGDRQKLQMAIFLATKYMIDFDAAHCRPLPPEMFQEPWDIKI